MTIAAMKQALEALGYGYDAAISTTAFETIQKAEQALRAAIKQAEREEPVAWITGGDCYADTPAATRCPMSRTKQIAQ